MQIVNQPVRKKDAMQLVTGQPVYMDDMIPERLSDRETAQIPSCKCGGAGDSDR